MSLSAEEIVSTFKAAAEEPKRKRGRPRKNPETNAATEQPKRKRGRPRKNPVPETAVAVVGNFPTFAEASAAADQPKRKRGRPRKNPVPAQAAKPKAEAKFEVHPIAKLLPEMSSGEKIELQRDIKKHGLRMPVITYRGKILDGRHRYAACREVGVTLRTEEFTGNEADATKLVLSLNLHRRHLNHEQKRELINALLKLNPKASNRSIAQTAKVDHKTVAAARRSGVDGGEIPHHAEHVGIDGVSQPAKKIAPKIDVPRKAIDGPDDADLAEIRYVWKKISPRARMLFVCSRRHEINTLLQGQECPTEGALAEATK